MTTLRATSATGPAVLTESKIEPDAFNDISGIALRSQPNPSCPLSETQLIKAICFSLNNAIMNNKTPKRFYLKPAKPAPEDQLHFENNEIHLYLKAGKVQYLVKDPRGNIQCSEIIEEKDIITKSNIATLTSLLEQKPLPINTLSLYDENLKSHNAALWALFRFTEIRGHTRQTTAFDSVTIPSMTVENYLKRLVQYLCVSIERVKKPIQYVNLIEPASLIVMAITLDAYFTHNKSDELHMGNVHRLILTSLLLAFKFADDFAQSKIACNLSFANIGGTKLDDMNRLEIEFLRAINYDLHFKPEVYDLKVRNLIGISKIVEAEEKKRASAILAIPGATPSATVTAAGLFPPTRRDTKPAEKAAPTSNNKCVIL